MAAARGRPGRPRRTHRQACCPSPDEEIAQVLAIRDYSAAPYLLLATKRGLVKKIALPAYDSPRQAGIIAVNFREDELIGAELCGPDDEVLLISRKGLAIRFPADDSSCGRWAGHFGGRE